MKKKYAAFNIKEYAVRILSACDGEELIRFLADLRQKDWQFIRLKDFNLAIARASVGRCNFITFGVFDSARLIGYFFLQLFFPGKAFMGRIVHEAYRSRGMGKEMAVILFNIARELNFSFFAIVHQSNLASLRSGKAVGCGRVVKELKNNYLLIKFK